MVNYTNYSDANITGFTGLFNYTATIMKEGTGVDLFVPNFIVLIFFIFFSVSIALGFARALSYSLFMCSISIFLLVAAALVDPIYLVWSLILTAGAIFML